MSLKLMLNGADTQRIYLNGAESVLHLSADKLFPRLPPDDLQWERAIQMVEDAIGPFVKEAKNIKEFELQSEILRPSAKDNELSREMVEQMFQQVSRYGFDPEIAQTAESYLHLLIVREWMHHFGYEKARMF